MKKIFCILIFICTTLTYSQNFTTENVKNYQGKTYHLYLLLGVVELQLDATSGYTARYESEGMYWYNSGKYKVEKGYIKLTPEICRQFADADEGVDCSSTLGEAKIDVIRDEYSLYYKEYLFVQSKLNKELLMEGTPNDNFRLPVPGTEVPEGETRMVGSSQVITMGMKKGITTSAVKIRKTASADGEELAYYSGIFEPEQKSVPINTSVTVIARTTEKVKVGKWENYWYCVQVGAHDGVWMYAEFVKFS
jgi:hypothetical protein